MKNELRVPLPEFKRVIGRFKEYGRIKPSRKGRKKLALSPEALIAFNGGFLSFEVGELVAAVRAEGEWHGRASISAQMLGVLALAPPIEDPVAIAYDGDRLKISTVTMHCNWEQDGAHLIQRVENPGPLDLLALDRTVSRAEIHGTDLGKRITQAKRTVEGSVTKAAKLLTNLGITENDLWDLIEIQVKARIDSEE